MKQLKTLLFAALVFMSTSQVNAQAKVAHVDTNAIMAAMPEMLQAQKQLETLKKAGKEVNFNNELNFKSYTTIDKKILFMAMENKNELLKNGKPKQEFIYSNKKTVDDGH